MWHTSGNCRSGLLYIDTCSIIIPGLFCRGGDISVWYSKLDACSARRVWGHTPSAFFFGKFALRLGFGHLQYPNTCDHNGFSCNRPIHVLLLRCTLLLI